MLYIFLIMNSLHDIVSPDYVPDCVRDEFHELTLPINRHLAQNPLHRSILIIVASTMMDINVLVMTLRFVFQGRNFKTFWIVLFFYAFRGFLQSVFFLKFPTEYIWGHPGMFSMTVPYAPANDFFYSGHVGLCTICFIDFGREKFKFMKYFSGVAWVIEFFTLLVTRAHYFIDLVIGAIVAHYIYLCGDWVYAYLWPEQKKEEPVQQVNGSSLEMAKKEETKQTVPNGKVN